MRDGPPHLMTGGVDEDGDDDVHGNAFPFFIDVYVLSAISHDDRLCGTDLPLYRS